MILLPEIITIILKFNYTKDKLSLCKALHDDKQYEQICQTTCLVLNIEGPKKKQEYTKHGNQYMRKTE